MQVIPISPQEMFRCFWCNRNLIKTLAIREVLGRYRGSIMGVLWSFFNPLLMLAVYTFVFSVVFNARWNTGSDSKAEFALVLFAGLIVYNLFSECINRSPALVLSNVNYVKKVIFPLEILPMVTMTSALFHTLVSLCVWMLAYLLIFGIPHITVLLFPIVIAPLIIFTLGLSWILASLGVYLRDVSHFISIVTTILLFMSPIFYPVSALPEQFKIFIFLNPLTQIIEQTRDVLFWGKFSFKMLLPVELLVSVLTAWLGFAWFQKTRKGFADVL